MAISHIAWHYTTGRHIESILLERCLRLESGFVLPRERRCCWFTTSEEFDATAFQAVQTKGGIHQITSAREQAAYGHNLFRVGVKSKRLKDINHWRRKSGVCHQMRQVLETTAVAQGVDPEDWFVSYKPVPSDKWETIEFSEDGDTWTELFSHMAATWDGHPAAQEVLDKSLLTLSTFNQKLAAYEFVMREQEALSA